MMPQDLTSFPQRWLDAAFCTVSVLQPDRIVLWLIGQIDLAAEEELARATSQAVQARRRLDLDCSLITFCDLTLVAAVRRIERQASVRIRRPSPIVLDLLRVAGAPRRWIAPLPSTACSLPTATVSVVEDRQVRMLGLVDLGEVPAH
jgi:hypothetical protein